MLRIAPAYARGSPSSAALVVAGVGVGGGGSEGRTQNTAELRLKEKKPRGGGDGGGALRRRRPQLVRKLVALRADGAPPGLRVLESRKQLRFPHLLDGRRARGGGSLHEQQLEPHAGELEQLGGGHGEQHAALLVAAFERFDAEDAVRVSDVLQVGLHLTQRRARRRGPR